MSDIRGLVIQSRLDYLENFYDNTVMQNIMKSLPDPVRQAVGEQVFPSNLYPFHYLRDLDTTIGEAIEKPLETIFTEIGESYAYQILDRYFYNYIESRDPQKFLAQLSKLYPYLWNFGEYTCQKSNARSATLRFQYDDDIYKPYCWFIQAFLKKGIELCGGNSVEIDEKGCESSENEACIYQVKWK
ncbi:MAG: hypothetical protein Kow0042_16440 [Calditrichia bacterium]